MSPISGIYTVSKKKNEGNYTLHIANRQVNYLFTGNKNFIKLGFHHILCNNPRGGHSLRGAGSIAWGLGFWLGKDIFKNIDMDNS